MIMMIMNASKYSFNNKRNSLEFLLPNAITHPTVQAVGIDGALYCKGIK